MAGIVIEQMKVVYWPIPKNACSAFKRHFARILGITNAHPNVHRAPFPRTKQPIAGYINFVLVRNPYARLYSLWVNKIAEGHPTSHHFVNELDVHVFKYCMDKIISGMPFEQFVYTILSSNVPQDPHWAPQSFLIPSNVQEFCRLEDICHILKYIIPKENVSHITTSWRDAYTQSLKDFVCNYYRDDFLRFGYEQD